MSTDGPVNTRLIGGIGIGIGIGIDIGIGGIGIGIGGINGGIVYTANVN